MRKQENEPRHRKAKKSSWLFLVGGFCIFFSVLFGHHGRFSPVLNSNQAFIGTVFGLLVVAAGCIVKVIEVD
jgi:hypothetical protein